MDIRFSMGSLRSHRVEVDIRALKLSQTILGAKFDENNTSAYFNSKHWQMKVDLSGCWYKKS